MHTRSPECPEKTLNLPDGIVIRPLTFLDSLMHMGTLTQAMMGFDVRFQPLERGGVTHFIVRWVIMPSYFHLGYAGYGAFEGEQLAGMIYYRGHQQALHIDIVVVHPDYRRRGVGRALLRLTEQQACRLGRHRLTTTVATNNQAAVRLYESEGFHPMHHHPAEGDVSRAMMCKRLA